LKTWKWIGGAKEATKDGTRPAIPKVVFSTMDEKDDANLGEGTQGMPIKSSLNNTKKDLLKAKVDELLCPCLMIQTQAWI
jgi:hypothetical protein